MTVVSYPGVYVEEIPSGIRTIEAASTSTAAFFGVAEKGPVGEMKKVFSFDEFKEEYGGFLDGYYLAYAVYQFFNNGGRQCYIGRIASDAQVASVTVKDQGGSGFKSENKPQPTITIAAESLGEWGNKLAVRVDSSKAHDKDNDFNLYVFWEPTPGSGEEPPPLEMFENLSMNFHSPRHIERVINYESKYIRVKDEASTNAIKGYSLSGKITGTSQILALQQRQFRINIHGDGYQLVDLETLETSLKGLEDPDLEMIARAIQDTIRQLTPSRISTNPTAYQVTVTVIDDDTGKKLLITSGLAADDSSIEIFDAPDKDKNAAGALHLGRGQGGTEVYGTSKKRPQDNIGQPQGSGYYLIGDNKVEGAVSEVVPGTNGDLLSQDSHYINALSWLDKINDVSLIAIPGIGSPAVVTEGMNYCRNRPLSDCFFIGDMDVYDDTLEGVQGFCDKLTVPNSYGAVYFPWLKMLDPTGRSLEPIPVPPSGFVAGIYARIDNNRGVWKAPAGTEAAVSGTVGLTTELTDMQQGELNKSNKSVCVIRKFPSAGIVLWGARTVSSDPEYRYIPVRRTAIMLRKSIYDSIQWAVFEPNDHCLWSTLRLNIESFMNSLFRAGAFQGEKTSDAYFVRCGLGDTMTQDDIDRGQVIVLVGFAPLKPAEFVIVRIQQKAGQQ